MNNKAFMKFLTFAAAAAFSAIALSGCSSGGEPGASPAPGKKAGLDGVVINEVVSVNTLSHIDPDYGAADWVELKNTSGEDTDISGWRLADNPAYQRALKFPDGTSIPAGGFLTVLCIPEANVPESDSVFIAPFGISRSGEKIYLSALENRSDMVTVPYLAADISYARNADGSYGYSNLPTFGAENSNVFPTFDEAAKEAPAADALRISELVNGKNGWAELRNVSDEEIDLSSYSLSDDEHDPMKWVFPAEKLAPGAFVVAELNELDPDSPLTASFKLGRSETALYLFNNLHQEIDRAEFDPAMPDGVSAVKTDLGVKYTAFVTKGGENSDRLFDTVEWTAMEPASAPLIINEVLANNKYSVIDAYGDRSDWVELYNQSDLPVDLSYYCLSDRGDDLTKWQLPKVALLPKCFVVIFLSGNETIDGEIHAPFGLSEGESIYLSKLDGMEYDSIEIPAGINPNVSVGRNGANEIRYYAAPTPGGSNTTYGLERFADAGGFNAHSVYISEVSAVHAVGSGGADWIELYNGSGSSVSLNGWSLTDDPAKPKKYKLDGFSVSAGGYAVFNCGKRTFSVSGSGDTVYLIDPAGGVTDVFDSGVTGVGVTSGRANLSQTGERCFFTTPTKGFPNASPVSGHAAEPVFSSNNLYVSGGTEISLSTSTQDAEIRYTLDGSAPTQNSKLYTSPITISKGTVIRARTYRSGLIPSTPVSRTFLTGDQHTLPVVCISLSSEDYSRMYRAEMSQNGGVKKGDRVPCSMEYYMDGRLAVSSGAGVKVSGASTAVYPQKSLSLYFRAGYGRSSLDFPFFDDCEISSFRSVLLRNGGQDAYFAHIRDSYIDRICMGMNIDIASFRPVIVYINGEYRGVYDLKENLNEDYVASHYGIDRDTVEIAKRNGYMLAGTKDRWNEMRKLCQTLDTSQQANFDRLAQYVDTDSIIDYLIARTYFYDGDMFNQKYWHTTDDAVKWRAIFYDSDYAMYGNSPAGNILPAYFNPNGVSSAHGYITNMDIFCALNKNKEWRDEFITRYIYEVKYRFNKENALPLFDELASEYAPEMPRQISRWHMPATYAGWQSELSSLRNCIAKRPDYALKNLRNYYHLSDSAWAEYVRRADALANN